MHQSEAISLQEKPIRRLFSSAWLVWGLAAAFFFVDYFARVAPSVMTDDLMRVFSVTAFGLGGLSSFFYWPYVSMQLPVGILIDNIGPRKLLAGAALICAGACLWFAATQNIYAACAARFLLGFASAFAFVGALKLASVWFPVRQFGLIAGTTQALGMLGAATAEGLLPHFVETMGWRTTLDSIGFLFIGLMGLIFILVRDHPKHVNKTDVYARAKQHEKIHLLEGFKIVIHNPQSWWNGIYAGLLYAPTAALGELWGTSFIHHAYPVTLEQAGLAIFLIFVGWTIGGPTIGWLSDYLGQRKRVMLSSSIASFAILSIVVFVPHIPFFILYVLLFCYGICNTGVGVAYAVAAEINPRHIAGTSLAFANMLSIALGAILQPVIGKLLDLQWDGTLLDGIPLYTAHHFRMALIILPACLLTSVFITKLIKENQK